jgi:hypothetical protein
MKMTISVTNNLLKLEVKCRKCKKIYAEGNFVVIATDPDGNKWLLGAYPARRCCKRELKDFYIFQTEQQAVRAGMETTEKLRDGRGDQIMFYPIFFDSVPSN